MALRTKETPEIPEINPEKVVKKLTADIRSTISSANQTKALLGISGGVDTSVLADLCARAIGADNVYGLQLISSPEEEAQAKNGAILARHLRIRLRRIEISRLVDTMAEMLTVPFHGEEAILRRHQITDRLRMVLVLDKAEQEGMCHISAVNRTEKLLGMGVVCGTFSPVYQPLSRIFKTHIYEIAQYLELPEQILIRQPSFELWKNPADGAEPRTVIKEIDKLLYLRLEKRLPPSKLKRLGFAPRFVSTLLKRLDEVHTQLSVFKDVVDP